MKYFRLVFAFQDILDCQGSIQYKYQIVETGVNYYGTHEVHHLAT